MLQLPGFYNSVQASILRSHIPKMLIVSCTSNITYLKMIAGLVKAYIVPWQVCRAYNALAFHDAAHLSLLVSCCKFTLDEVPKSYCVAF